MMLTRPRPPPSGALQMPSGSSTSAPRQSGRLSPIWPRGSLASAGGLRWPCPRPSGAPGPE
eukprot:10647037-Alexandrium_andersonii.AAC.1